MKKTIHISSLALALMLAPFMASAAVINVNTSVDASVGASSTSQDANGDTSTSIDATVMPPNTTAAVTTNTATDLDIDLGREDVAASDSDATGMNATAAPMVATSNDLDAYVRSTLRSDSRVDHVAVTSDDVSLGYTERAHLFGLFPMLVTATATADAEGNVTVKYPWYRFLMTTDSDEIQAALTAQLATGSGSAGGQMTASTAANTLAVMHDVMKARLDASASATASGSTSTSY